MNRRSIVAIVAVVVAATAIWFGGHGLWNLLLAMHGRR